MENEKAISKVSHLVVFQKKDIRRTLHNNEWFFVVSDIVEALTESKGVKSYIQKMRNRDNELSKEWGRIVTPLEIATEGG